MDKNIKIVSRDKCTGCGACFNKCPKNAIVMEYDNEGFLYPKVTDECINCGLCVGVCHVLQQNYINTYKSKKPDCYAMKASEEILKISSSGGMFSVLANYVFEKDGYVCGAAYSDDYFNVQHIVIKSPDELDKLRGSKYVQSDTNTTYKEVKEYLDKGKLVLYTGVACQIAGLRAFLKQDYDNLILADILCHGGPSPKVYKKYLSEIAKGRKIKKVDFREKAYWGWGTASSIFFEDGSIYRNDCFKDEYWRAFLSGLSTRECCKECYYANTERIGDFSIGDFWGIDLIEPQINDRLGTSIVLANNEKAKKLLVELERKCKLLKKVNLNDAKEVARTRNGQLLWPQRQHWARKRFFELLETKSFFESFDNATNSKYDVGIVGWWYNENYGGTLTYFALHQVLKKMGQSVLMIAKCSSDPNYKPKYNSIPLRFAQKNYKMSKNHTPATIAELNNHCKTFISGSDQLFNPTLWQWSGPQYFLNYVGINKNIISYASSFGQEFYDNNDLKFRMSYWLHRFNSISVREDYAVDICKNIFDLEAVHVIDPVFLCDVKEYEEQAAKSNLKKESNYLLSFFLDPDEDKRKLILELSKKLKLEYINLIDAINIEENAKKLALNNTQKNIDVEGWLFYYKNADFVITDSFHGTCFAIIFKKKFISIANKKRGTNRFVSVLKIFGLENHLVYDISEIENKLELFDEIDYKAAYEKALPKITFSYKWLENAIKNPRKKKADMFNSLNYAIEELKKQNVELRRQIQELQIHTNIKTKSKEVKNDKFNTNIKKTVKYYKEYGLLSTIRKIYRTLNNK